MSEKWELRLGGLCPTVHDEAGRCILTAWNMAAGPDAAEAAARKAAAAPDLLAALTGIIDMATHAGFGADSPIVLTARAAIIKATGSQP